MVVFLISRYTHIRWLPCIVIFAWGSLMLVTPALALPQHPDEAQYGWSAAYFTTRLVHLDFTLGDRSFTNPGWNPLAYWNKTQPMMVRFLYGGVILQAHLPIPERPYNYDPPDTGTETLLPLVTLYVLRVVAISCAVLGAALFAWRFGWPGGNGPGDTPARHPDGRGASRSADGGNKRRFRPPGIAARA